MKPLSMGQRALYDIACDVERARNFLINLAEMQAEVRAWRRNMLIAFALGLIVGMLWKG